MRFKRNINTILKISKCDCIGQVLKQADAILSV